MPQVSINGVVEDTGPLIDTATFIRVAQNADLTGMLVHDTSNVSNVSMTVLPENLQTELKNCDGNYGCKYVGYDFDRQQVVSTTGGEPKLLELQPFVDPNVGVFVKEGIDPIEFESLPTYDLSYTAYLGVPLQTITPSVPAPEKCAATCDTLGNCEGFNYNSLTNTCAFFPAGREKDYTGNNVSFNKIYTTSFWSYLPGESNLEPQYYTCASSAGSLTGACTIWRTPDLNFVNVLPGGYIFWDVTKSRIAECNAEILRLLNEGSTFTTGVIKGCKGLPSRSFKKKTTNFIVVDETDNSVEVNPSTYGSTIAEVAYDMLHFGQLPMTMPPNGWSSTGATSLGGFNGNYCQAGQRPSFFGCVPCTETLGTNSYWVPNKATSWCKQFQCPPQRYVDYGVNHMTDETWISSNQAQGLSAFGSNWTAGITPYYCAKSPNGKLVYTDPNGIISLQDCTNTVTAGQNYNSIGYSSSSSTICPTTSCLWSVPLYDKEIWSSGCTKTQLNYGEIRVSGSDTTTQQCPALTGQRYFYLHPRTCDQCSVPVGKNRVPASGSSTYYADGTRYSYSSVLSPGLGYPEYGCSSTPCPRSPGANEIWDLASSNLCAIRTCSNNDMPNAAQTACSPRPGFTSLCDLDSDCVCDDGTRKSNGQCVELTSLPKGFVYSGLVTTGRSCLSLLMPRTSSQVYSYDCTTRACYATTTPDPASTNPTECVRCATEPYNSGTTRYGYISNVQGGGIDGAATDSTIGGNFLEGCTLGICPAPSTTPDACDGIWSLNDETTCWKPPDNGTCPAGSRLISYVCIKDRPIKRWKYGKGCDWVQCPRAPKTTLPTSTTPGERWAGDFGCDITSWTYAIGQTTCTTFPSAGNYWTNSYGCGISACRRELDLGCDANFVKITDGPYSLSFPDEENKYCRLVKPGSGCPAGTTTFVNDTAYCYKALNTTPALSATNGEIWGPQCTKMNPVALNDTRNASNTYFLKCTNWPDLGQKFGTTPCTTEPCNFTPARGYVWKHSTVGACETRQCPSYTFPDSTATRCLPCPVDRKTVGQVVVGTSVNYGRYGWRRQTAPTFQDSTQFNNLCRVDGCSEISGQTLSQGQYWADVACSVKNMCTPGSEVINRWKCSACSTSLQSSNDIWSTPGTCAISACGIQTQPNATSNICVACPLMTLAFGYTYTMTQGCTVTACPAIASSNIWTTNGSCESMACTGHTQPNAAKASCDPCPNPPKGNQWSSADGCAYTACSAIASSNIFTTIGACDSTACTGHTQPDATKTGCVPCSTLLIGNIWSSTDGCAYTACPAIASSSIWQTIGTCASTACTGHTQPDATKTTCVACTNPPLGNRWSSASGCGYTVCSAISTSNVFTTTGTCDSAPCTTGHNKPNATQTACVPCTDPPFGNAWSFINGCSYTACPAIASNSIWTTIGTCASSVCSGHTQPNAAKTSCLPCTNPSYGNIWSSSDGCSVSMCPNILPGNRYDSSTACTSSACTGFPANSTWDPTDTRGGCRFTCTVLPGQKITDQNTCTIETFKVLMSTSSLNVKFTVASASLQYYSGPPTHYMQLTAGGSFTFDIPAAATDIRIVANGVQYFMHITTGFGSWVASNSNEFNLKQKIFVYLTDSTGAKLSATPVAFNIPGAVLTFGNITDFACDPPAPGFTYDTGCTTKSCPMTLAPGFFWDPSGGCSTFSCSTTLGITLGYNQFWSGTGCIVSTCPVGTVLTNGSCAAVCDPAGVTLASGSIYVPRQGLSNLPTCPVYSVAGVPGNWFQSDSCDLGTLIPGATYKFSTCLTSTQNYTGSCDPYDLTSGQTADCSVYVASGSTILIGPLVANGQVVSGTTRVDLYDDQNNLIIGDTSGLIDIPINGPSGMYTLRQTCTSGPCRGQSGYSGAATASNFQYNTSGSPELSDGNGNIYDTGTNETGCDTNPPFYDGTSITVSLPLDSVGPYTLTVYANGPPGIQGQPVITVPSDSYCVTQPCVGRTQPDASKTLCQACTTTTLSPGIRWASTNGCATQACTNTPSLGNTWNSTDTTGACAVIACSSSLITGQYWASSGYCATGMCTKGQTVNTAKTGCTACAAIALSNIFTTVGTCASSVCSGHAEHNSANTSCVTCTNPLLGNAWSSTSGCAYTACSAIASSNIFTTVGTCASSACTGRNQPNAAKTSCVTCPTLLSGNTWSSTSGCAYTACTNALPYGNVWDSTDTNGACRQLACSPTIAANQIYTQTGTCSASAVSNCAPLTGGSVYSTSRPSGLGVCPSSGACSTLATYGQYYLYPGITCGLGTCSIPVNQYFTTIGTCSSPKSNCSNIAQGTMYSSSRPSGLGVCSSVVACPTALSGTNGWVTDTLGTGTCSQKVLTWSQTATISVAPFSQGTLQVRPVTSTTTDVDRNCAIFSSVTDISGTQPLQTVSQWASGFPVSSPTGHTHIRFPFNMGSGTTEWTFQVSTPYTGTDKYIYGYFVGTNTNARVNPYTGNNQPFSGTNTFKFGKYT